MSESRPSRLPAPRFARRASVGSLLGATTGLLLVLAVIGVGLALVANGQLTRKRHQLLQEIGPAFRNALELESALVNEETGLRGYLLTSDRSFLAPYESGLKTERRAFATLQASKAAISANASADVQLVRTRVEAWRRRYATPVLANPRGGKSIAPSLKGKALFNSVRQALSRLQSDLTREDDATKRQLDSAADTLEALLIVAAALILGGILGAGYLLRRAITRPLARLGAEARRVAAGEFQRPLSVASGPLEVSALGGEIDAMRQRIVDELASVEAARARLEEQAEELRRSNAELEQFAYVASHDLQEPLRKVASFCQALQTRYQGQLDERADQYIDFAVDGAKRMQTLINDLLAFSRVGRSGRQHERVELSEALQAARSVLAAQLQTASATVLADPLPAVLGDRALLTSLFQNLISNAVKFRSDDPPSIRIEVIERAQEWELSCTDNGIGVEGEYAERIFLIFQRLHSREAYEGSGIGLALCRKIVEYHGGRIWLDTSVRQGACFRFTLPFPDDAQAERTPNIAKEAIQ